MTQDLLDPKPIQATGEVPIEDLLDSSLELSHE